MRDKGSLTKRSAHIIVIGAIFVFLLTFLVYTSALKNDFVWDDYPYVYENTNIRSLNYQSLYWMLTSFHTANWHPLTWLSHAIDYAFWNLNPNGHHLTNIILHGLNTILVFLLIIRLISSAMSLSISTKFLMGAGITALLFGLHPLHVESVAWVAERKDLLCAFFFILSILSYLSYASLVIKKYQWIWFTTCLVTFVCALMSKPMAVTLPLILLLLDLYPLKRLEPYLHKNLSVLLEKIPFFVLSIASSIITIIAQHSRGAVVSFERLPISFRLLNAVNSLVFYLKKVILPLELIPLYPYPKNIYPLDLQCIISAVLILAITGFCLWMVKQGKYLFFIAWSYYVVTLLPVVGIIQVGNQAAADRYSYLPSISPFFLIGIGFAFIWEKVALKRGKRISRGFIMIFTFIAMSLLSCLTFKQIKIWQNSEILWSYVINASPEKIPLAHYNLGTAYAIKGMLDQAIPEFKEALAIDPNYAKAHNKLGLAYYNKGMLNEAISEYKEALAINPNYAEVHNNLGNVYFKKGRLDEALAEYKQVLTIKPNLAKAYYNLGLVYAKKGRLDEAISEYKRALITNPNYAEAHYNLGVAYKNEGRLDKAISECMKAIAINPNYAEAHYDLGLAYYNKGMLNEAISEYKKALTIKPNLAEAHYNLGLAYYNKGMLNEAISEYKKALTINPNYAEAHNNIGIIYKKRGRLDEAISEYMKELTINPNYAEAYINLGIAYNNKGMFDEAISVCERALTINPNYAEAYINLGIACHNKGELDKAISEYKRAMAIKPDYPLAHNNLALSYYLKGNYRLAIIHCDKAVELGYSVNPKLLELLKPFR